MATSFRNRKQGRWTDADLALAQARAAGAGGRPTVDAPAKRAKYRNTKVTVDGVTYDSAGEHARYVELCRLQEAGKITELKRSVYFVLAPAVDLGEGRKKPALRYKADFTYREGGQLVVEDFKSDITRKLRTYRDKKHLMMTMHGILIRESSR